MGKTDSLIAKDRKFIWHPFTQMRDWQTEDFPVIDRGEGCYLIDTEGRRYLDGVSSLWCNVHGHRVKELDSAIKKQIKKIGLSYRTLDLIPRFADLDLNFMFFFRGNTRGNSLVSSMVDPVPPHQFQNRIRKKQSINPHPVKPVRHIQNKREFLRGKLSVFLGLTISFVFHLLQKSFHIHCFSLQNFVGLDKIS